MKKKNLLEKRKFPRIMAKLPIRVTPQFFGEIVDLSEAGLGFVLDKPLPLSKFQAKIEISPKETIETNFKVIWNKQLVEQKKFMYGVCFIRFKEKDLKILRKSLITTYTHNLINSIKEMYKKQKVRQFWYVRFNSYLNDLSALSSKMDNELITHEDAFSHVLHINNKILKYGDELEMFLEDKVLVRKIKRIFRQLCSPWVYRSDIVKYAYEKQRGYPGDYKLLEIIYDKTILSSNIGYCYDNYFLENLYAVAVRNRKDKMKEILGRFFKSSTKDNLSILNVACGSARELKDIFVNDKFEPECNIVVNLVDQDKEALEFSRKSLESSSKRIGFKYFNHNILDYCKEKEKYSSLLGKHDMVYSIGLADYLPERFLKRLILFCFDLLKPNGILVIAHKDSKQYKPLAPDWWCDWTFYHRSEEDVVNIFRNSNIFNIKVERDPSSVMFFVISEKK